jgi:hypothetical protein
MVLDWFAFGVRQIIKTTEKCVTMVSRCLSVIVIKQELISFGSV